MKTCDLRAIKAHWSHRWRLFCSRDGLGGVSRRIAVLVLGAFLALSAWGCAPEPARRDLVTVAQYPDGSFSVDVYDADGTLATTAHLPADARMADAFPKGDMTMSKEHFHPSEMFVIDHPQVGPVHVRSVFNGGTTTYQECTRDWELPRTATPLYAGLSRPAVLALGGVLVKTRNAQGEEVIAPAPPE